LLIINKYLIREVFTTLLAVTTVLLLIFISGQLASLFSKAASGALNVNTILALLGLKSLSNLVFILPLSFYLAVLLAFSRLYRDNEMVVLAACGVGQLRLVNPVIKLAIFFALLIGVLALYLAPWAQDMSRKLINESESSSDLKALSAGRFKEIPGGSGVIYVEETEDESGKLKNIFIQITERTKNKNKNKKNSGNETIISAAAGSQMIDDKTGSRFLVLEKGFRYEGQAGVNDYVEIQFDKHGIRLTDQELLDTRRRHKEKSTQALLDSWKSRDIAEFQWRVSLIFLSVILAVLAVPLSKTSARQGRYTKLAVALLIYIIYTNLLNVSRVWVERAEISSSIGLWWVHVVMLMVTILFFIDIRKITESFFYRRKSTR